MSENNTNDLMVAGQVLSMEEAYEHKSAHGTEKFYQLMIESPRLSGNMDTLPIIVPENLLFRTGIKEGAYVGLTGEIRTKHISDEKHQHKSHLKVFGFSKDIFILDKEDYENENLLDTKNAITLEGYVVKQPHIRETKTGRVITDLLIASNGMYRSNYIPVICWGSNAKMASKFVVGDKVKLEGRFQSRKYYKHIENDTIENTAYEISVIGIELCNKDEAEKKEIA